jgi:hypothetical protein
MGYSGVYAKVIKRQMLRLFLVFEVSGVENPTLPWVSIATGRLR